MTRRRAMFLIGNLVILSIFIGAAILFKVANATTDEWEIVSSPNDGTDHNYLFGVAAAASNSAVTVGSKRVSSNQKPLIEVYTDTNWSVVSNPSITGDGVLEGVDEVPQTNPGSATQKYWAVGFQDGANAEVSEDTGLWEAEGRETLIERSTDNGQTWSIVSSPNPGSDWSSLRGVFARTDSDVWAVGSYKNTGELAKTLILHYNGTSWSTVTSPNVSGVINDLVDVYAVSANEAYAVGYTIDCCPLYDTLVLEWDGTDWEIVTSENPSSGNYLFDVTCAATGTCKAVGTYGSSTKETLVLTRNTTSGEWEQEQSPNQPDAGNWLRGIDHISSTYWWAVGGYDDSPFRTLIMKRNSSSWSIVESPNNGEGQNELHGVSVVPGTTACGGGDIWATGFYVNSSSVARTLIERYTISPSCGR